MWIRSAVKGEVIRQRGGRFSGVYFLASSKNLLRGSGDFPFSPLSFSPKTYFRVLNSMVLDILVQDVFCKGP